MAEPKKKKSNSRSNSSKNASGKKLIVAGLTLCVKCKEQIPSHMVCVYCGSYGNIKVKKVS
ncbi:50S ribosomal protein L32 [Candidatus Berkelbacteria bacterium]|uniref:Large ribosomal subunit protein bL32 n=1 Tax=Candidatus Berkelbacteria bacterium CG10_big_fil_rev_8_21_14_0_10_43_14 TaxID=1974515 RepID=A0A2M6R894_9BACT|nr:50S ribosomal protein L32 [Candidatus Berkelbacteria bacterium]OIP06893.1 MAG: 50S ribosomal protein L32 [Candidatus Berkelbacteria bacterium CG2_30_43_20]PIS06753.1 MAG: 50S ribosomal protein L32 [Candidatus Berkelbacteria bacterium CG10_big_fil_rev_8_21_14_0_10_43_14]PIU87072.1 MAG: 50S ribosomal protein L32 [Candidatus Berkelbacteria bacterium CG06_land_8_20_14_3_00_43_10]